MERLTIIDGCGNDELARCMNCGLEKAGSNLENCGMCEEGWQRALRRLAAYEVTGLTPEEIKNALDVNDIIPEINVTVDHIRDLIKAEQDGRLVVLPWAVGDVIYEADKAHGVVKHIFAEKPAWMMHSYAIDDAGNEWYDGWGSSDETPFYKTREEAEAALAVKGGDV